MTNADSILYGKDVRRSSNSQPTEVPQDWIDKNKREFKVFRLEAQRLRHQLEGYAMRERIKTGLDNAFFQARNLVDDILEDKRFNDLAQTQHKHFRAQRQTEDDFFNNTEENRTERVAYLDVLLLEIEELGEDVVRTDELQRMLQQLKTAKNSVTAVISK